MDTLPPDPPSNDEVARTLAARDRRMRAAHRALSPSERLARASTLMQQASDILMANPVALEAFIRRNRRNRRSLRIDELPPPSNPA